MVSLTWSIEKFLRALGSSDPVPGGGSAAALTGSLGCALERMVCRILLARRRLKSSDRARLRKSLKELESLEGRLRRLIQEDARAYRQWVQAYRSGKGIVRARKKAIEVPLAICEQAVKASGLAAPLGRLADTLLRSDLKAAQALLKGSFIAAWAMVEVNLKDPK